MFVLLFVYVFGGSLVVPGYDDYKQYLVPGVFAQTALWGSAFTGIGVAEDRTSGLVDRLRSLPIAPAAVLVGRTISDLVRNTLTFVVMFAVAWLVGFRFEGSALQIGLATALLFAFSYAFSWVQAYMGLSVSSVEAANSAGYIWMFPLTFVSSAYVDPSTMPSWLEPIAEANPFTALTDAGRALYNGRDPGADWWIALLWAVGITVVFASLCARRFSSTPR
jgi:ABC-2 type transport system permease protein